MAKNLLRKWTLSLDFEMKHGRKIEYDSAIGQMSIKNLGIKSTEVNGVHLALLWDLAAFENKDKIANSFQKNSYDTRNWWRQTLQRIN